MTVRKVLTMGDPRLYQISQPVKAVSQVSVQELIEDMWDTIYDLDGAGLAAPQIGVLQRVVIFEVGANPRYPDVESVPKTVLINPVIEPLGPEQDEGWEGCLSVPGLRGLVPRYTHIKYRGMDQNGAELEREVSGFHARVVQHECDHLDGILYPIKIRDLRNLMFEDHLTEQI